MWTYSNSNGFHFWWVWSGAVGKGNRCACGVLLPAGGVGHDEPTRENCTIGALE